MNKWRYLICCLGLVALPRMGWGRLGAPINASWMLSAADAVVKGEVLGTRTLGPAVFSDSELKRNSTKRYLKGVGAQHVVAQVRVDRVLKGGIKPGAIIDVRSYSAPNDETVRSFKTGDYAILFLTGQGGQFSLVDIDDGKLLTVKRADISLPSGDPQANLMDEFHLMTTAPDEATVITGLNGLVEFHTLLARDTLKDFSHDKRPAVRALAISGLIGLSDDSAISQMFAELNSGEMNTDSYSGQELQEACGSYVSSIEYLGATKSVRYSDSLIQLASHKNRFVREAALRALRQIKPAQAIPTFVDLLGSSDPKIEYLGVISLCEIAKSDKPGCPSSILFARDRQKYIDELKAWGVQHRP